jgi:hypothetical protein
LNSSIDHLVTVAYFITWSHHDCIMLIIVPYYTRFVELSSYEYGRSRSLGVRDPNEQVREVLVVHKCHVTRILTLLWSRQAPAHHTQSLTFIFELIPLCYEWLCIRLVRVVWNHSYIVNTFRVTLDGLASIPSYDSCFKSHFTRGLCWDRITWDRAGSLGGKRRIIGWEGWGVWCGKLAPPRLWPPPVSVKGWGVGTHE